MYKEMTRGASGREGSIRLGWLTGKVVKKCAIRKRGVDRSQKAKIYAALHLGA